MDKKINKDDFGTVYKIALHLYHQKFKNVFGQKVSMNLLFYEILTNSDIFSSLFEKNYQMWKAINLSWKIYQFLIT